MRVLIAGGGPTGLTLAIDLARRGVEVRVVDKADGFFRGSRADTIQPRTLEVFDDLGVVDAVLDAGCLPPAYRVHLDGDAVEERRMAELRAPRPDQPYPNPWTLGQSQLEGILRSRLAELGTRVELATELVGLEQDKHAVTARFQTGETARFDYLVGADGGASTVRKATGIAFPGTTDETFRLVIGDVHAPGLDPAIGHWFAAATSPMTGVAMTPLPGTGMFQLNTAIGTGEDASLTTMQTALDGFSAGVHLTGCHWATVWRPNIRLAERFRAGRVFLAGDAAHVHPPTGGQGMNTGIQDAYNLGWKLAAQTLLDSYETERKAVAATVLKVSDDLLRQYAAGHAEAHQRGEEHLGLHISYRTQTAPGALAPGDRAPDAPVQDPTGKRIRLFDLFRGPHATRLVFGAPAPDTDHSYAVLRPGDDPAGCSRYVIDTDGNAFTAYSVLNAPADGHILVRPDGHLA
ncbi:FAD-dependent monooxygenase [Actinacidiphila sp. ITFR-21]|uniref:FAD-dependent monooxygenase n=1 Tax=Actinacidiphila sp. ITFR-21 TaxID=3075199 RepID=UPI0028896CC7|nr:FAD-dependent monooxygenase [Streptomyces sp. ITFR-21]WNI15386.1 FAD-dependent monooxygenase [Streptomyces sp. ITFR-21]